MQTKMYLLKNLYAIRIRTRKIIETQSKMNKAIMVGFNERTINSKIKTIGNKPMTMLYQLMPDQYLVIIGYRI